jgi:methyl-accepting chemotaxis protein
MDEQQLENRLTKLEESLDYIGEDIEELKDNQQEIKSLALSVNTLAIQVKRLVDDMINVNCRMDNIEKKPAQRWEAVIGALIGLVVSGFGGFIIGKMIGG